MAWIAPSVLSADFVNLEKDIRVMEAAGAKLLHLDVMDGHFVPNITFGQPVIAAMRQATDLILDVHLMITNAEEAWESYIEAGANYLTVHYEEVTHLDRVVSGIRDKGAQPGVVLNPHTPVSVLEEILPKCHHVLIMSVNPGFGGQKFIPGTFDKLRRLKEMIDSRGLDVKIEIDGGIGPHNTREVVEAGVELLVSGSALFGADDPTATFREMQGIADSVGVSP